MMPSWKCWSVIFFFKQKTAYGWRISDWSSDVCSSDLSERAASDVDLLVISDLLNYSILYESLSAAEMQLARRVNPVLLTLEQWRNRLSRDESFASRIVRGEVIVIQEAPGGAGRSEERRGGEECVSTCRSRGWPG